MRILHAYKHYLPEMPGGIASAISELVNEPSAGKKSEVLTCAAGFGAARQYVHEGVSVMRARAFGSLLSMPISPSFPLKLRAMASEFDVLALHHPFPLNDVGLFLRPKDCPPIVVHWHAEILGRPVTSSLVAPFIRHTLRRASRIVVSDDAIIEHSAYLHEFREKCAVLPYGISYQNWNSASPADQLEIVRLRNAHPRLIVAFGRLVPYKGFDVLIRAMASVDATLIIIGEGTARAELEALVSQTAVGRKVIFAGHLSRDQVRQHLHAARIFAFPSVTNAEAFGIAQLEAMAAGLPIVNTSLPTAVPHVARNDREALTVSPSNVDELQTAINRLLSDASLAHRLGTAGQARVQERYTVENYSHSAFQIYESVVAEHSRTVRRS